MSYVYIRSERTLWTVGHYDPRNSEWIPESDHDSPDKAAERVRFLNGASDTTELLNRVNRLIELIENGEHCFAGVSPDFSKWKTG